MATRIQLRRGAASQWSSLNPILNSGEPGLETDTGHLKVGDGSTTWNNLPYLARRANTPTVVGSSITYVGAVTSVVVTHPTGLQVGDTLIACATNGWVPNTPTGWSSLAAVTTGSNISGRTMGKTVVSADVGGSTTFTFTGSYGGEVMLAAVRGAGKLDGVGNTQDGSSVTTITTSFQGRPSDLILHFCGARGSSLTLTADKGTLLVRRNADASASGAIYSETWPTSDPFYGVVNWTSSAASAMYAASVSLSV